MKKIILGLVGISVGLSLLVFTQAAKADVLWDMAGNYTIDFVCTSGCSGTYTHQMNIASMDLGTGAFSGTGNYQPGTPTWTHSGYINGSDIDFTIDYDGSTYYVDVIGTIASNGSISGTASNNTQTFNWSTTGGTVIFNRHAEITVPVAGDVNSVNVNFEAYLVDNDYDNVSWAVRQGTCVAGTNTVFGNVDGHSDVANWDYNSMTYMHTFSITADTSIWGLGMYCFIFNPAEDSGESNIRLTREFQLVDNMAPFITIESPENGDDLNRIVSIFGTIVEDRELSHYNIAIYPGDADFMDFSERLEQETVYRTDGFNNELIYQWDTTLYPDGEYLIRLAARDKEGNRDVSGDPYLGGDDSQHVITVLISNTKADILIVNGVPGKGIATAPGLQKAPPNDHFAKNNKFTLSENAEEVAPGIFYLGESVDKGKVVEGYAFVHYTKDFDKAKKAKPVWDDTVDKYKLMFGGIKWADTMQYEVNTVGSKLNETAVMTVLGNSLETWDDAITGDFELFNDPIGISGETSVGRDYTNLVMWGDLGSGGTIAVNYFWFYQTTKEMVESDVVFNTYYDWNIGNECSGDMMDLQSIATHEFGHNGLNDLYMPKSIAMTMHGYSYGYCEIHKRTLGTGDISGIQALYGN